MQLLSIYAFHSIAKLLRISTINWQTVSRSLGSIGPYSVVGAVGVVGTLLSITAASLVGQWELGRGQARFEQQSTALAGALQRRVDSYAQATRSLGALYETSGEISEREFQAFTASLLPYYRDMLGLGWAPQISAADRSLYEALQGNRDGFSIQERDGSGSFVAVGDRPIFFPNTYLAPSEKLEAYLGFDAYSDPKRRWALERAERLGILTSTKQVQLENGKPGFIFYRPVFQQLDGPDRSNLPQTSQDEASQFQGVVFGMYEVDAWVRQAIATLDLKNLDFYLYQLPEDQLDSALLKPQIDATETFLIAYKGVEKKLITSPQTARLDEIDVPTESRQRRCAYSQSWLFCIRTINVAQQEFSLLVLPSQARISGGWHRNVTLLVGLLTTSFVVLYLWRAQQTTRQIQMKNEALESLLHQLKQAQSQLVQTEKMSSLGQLVAGVAHEIRNPISFIKGNIAHLNNYVQDLSDLIKLYQQNYPNPSQTIQTHQTEIELDFLLEDLPQLIGSIKMGSDRITNIVASMQKFSRSNEVPEQQVDIHDGIDSTLLLLKPRLNSAGNTPSIQVNKQYGTLPPVECYSGQLNQVFMNLLSNAIDALQDQSGDRTITISTQAVPAGASSIPTGVQSCCCLADHQTYSAVAVCIQDNGPGIPTEVQARLFDPFFTTKPVGKGTGLGLSISYQIVVDKHHGQLQCQSNLGEGAQFWIYLPIVQHSTELIVETGFANA